MTSRAEELSELRNNFEFASFTQFMHTFHVAFGLESFDTEDFEEQLFADRDSTLVNLIIKMLRIMTGNRFINQMDWGVNLYREMMKRKPDQTVLQENDDFFELPVKEKIQILYELSEYQLEDPDRFRKYMNQDDEESAEWRIDPVGYDRTGNIYWLFDDNRLYCETIPKRPSQSKRKKRTSQYTGVENEEGTDIRSRWSLVCSSREDWESFVAGIQDSRDQNERALHDLLVEEVLPQVVAMYKEKEKTRKMEELLLYRKRSGRLQMKELEKIMAEQEAAEKKQKEDERRQRAEAEASERLAREREEERRRRHEAREQRSIEIRTMRQVQEVQVPKPPPKKKIEPKEVVVSVDQEETWLFECFCGIKQRNYDDGTPMIACEKCDTWSHQACVNSALGKKNWKKSQYICKKCAVKDSRKTADSRNRKKRKASIDNKTNDHGPSRKQPKLTSPTSTFDTQTSTGYENKLTGEEEIVDVYNSDAGEETDSDTEQTDEEISAVKTGNMNAASRERSVSSKSFSYVGPTVVSTNYNHQIPVNGPLNSSHSYNYPNNSNYSQVGYHPPQPVFQHSLDGNNHVSYLSPPRNRNFPQPLNPLPASDSLTPQGPNANHNTAQYSFVSASHDPALVPPTQYPPSSQEHQFLSSSPYSGFNGKESLAIFAETALMHSQNQQLK